MNELIAIQKIAGWERLKTLVLDSVSSPITKRVYNMALDEFMAWVQQAPRPGFTKATVSAWRVSLEDRKLGSSSIIIRMSAIRKLAAEAADNGLLAPELAAGNARVKSGSSRLRLAAIRGGCAQLRTRSATRWSVVYRRSGGEARPCPNRAHAELGKGGDRRLDFHLCGSRWPRFPARESCRPSDGQRSIGEGRLAAHQAPRRSSRSPRHRSP